jgi:hypothetical protein
LSNLTNLAESGKQLEAATIANLRSYAQVCDAVEERQRKALCQKGVCQPWIGIPWQSAIDTAPDFEYHKAAIRPFK